MSAQDRRLVSSLFLTARRHWPMVLLLAGLAAAMTAGVAHLQPPMYGAQAQLMLKFGREYTYRPEVDGLQGWQPSRMVELVNAEVRLLGSRTVRAAVVDSIGIAKLYPDLADIGLPSKVARDR